MELANVCCIAYYSTSLFVVLIIYGKKIKNFLTSKKRFYVRWFYNFRNRSKGYKPVPNYEI
jgi:hypothetical protein